MSTASKKQVKTKQTPGMIATTVSMILAAVLVVGIVGWSILDSVGVIDGINGLLDRNRISVESNNYQITGSELSVYAFQAAQVYSQQAQSEYMYYQYGLSQDTYGVTEQFKTAEEYAAYIVSYYREEGQLKETAYGYAEEYLAFCEGAKAAGYTLPADDNQVDEYMEQLQKAADESKDYKSLKAFIKGEFGPGVRESDIRSAMEIYFLSKSYSEVLKEQYADGTTDAELEKYLNNNKTSFYKSEYASYELLDNAMKDAADKCKDVVDIKTMICNYLVDAKYEEAFTSHITKKDVALPDGVTKDSLKADVNAAVKALCKLNEEDPFSDKVIKDHAGKDDEAFYKAGQAIAKVIYTSVESEVTKIKKDTSATYADPAGKDATDLQKWLFDADRKEGDVWVQEVSKTNEDGNKTSTYTLYVASAVMKLDTDHKRHVGYVLFSDDKAAEGATDEEKAALKTAEQKAKAFYDALKAGEITEDAFTDLAMDHSNAATFFYDMASTDTPTDVSSWAFKSERKEGDVEIIVAKKAADDKSTTAPDRYVAYYVEENEENWKATIRETLTTEKMTNWVKDTIKEYNVISHHGHSHDHDETTTAAPGTTAA